MRRMVAPLRMIVNCICDGRHAGLALGLLLGLQHSIPTAAQDAALPNLVFIDAVLATAGQPDRAALAALGAEGYGLVVNLAPPDARNAIADEGALVTQGGASYVSIPVAWQSPLAADFDLFSAVLDAATGRRTLVHCVVNRRASVFTFLYRVVHRREPPAEAYRELAAVWTPEPHWDAFIDDILLRHGIEFEPPAPE
jgi:protein tyrosine phosphatase (PTP) superfamily phosphohydrolase (DUF442 family)